MGLALLVLFVLYICFSIVVYKLVAQKTKSIKIRILTIVILVLIATWDNIIGLAAFHYLCKTQGGQKIYRTVENAEGYIDDGGKYGYIEEYDDLVKGRYKFIEVEVKRDSESDKRNPMLSSGYNPVRLPNGKYRYYLTKAGSPHCEYFYKRKASFSPKSLIYSSYYKNFPDDYCMATERINSFKSKYVYEFKGKDKWYPLFRISKQTSTVFDVKTKEVLGSATSISYCGGWIIGIMSSQSCAPVCPPKHSVYERSIHLTLLEKVLKPNYVK